DKVEGRPLRLAVPPGRYLVRKHLGAEVGLLSFELTYGGERVLDESQMQHRHFSEVALKGGYVELRPHGITLNGAFENEQLQGNGGRWRAGLGYRYTWDAFWLGAGLGAGYWPSSAQQQQLSTRETQVGLTFTGGYRFLARTLVPFIGLLGEVRWLHQTYLRDNEALLEATFKVGPVPPRDTVGFAIGAIAGLEVPLAERFFLSASAAVTGRWLRAENQLPWTLGVDGLLGVG